METEVWRIGDLARATGTKVETIRFYEKSGLLPAPPRTAGNYRAYSAEHLDRLSFILRARDLGFSMEQVATLLALADRKDQSCEAVDIVARTHLAKIDHKLRDLRALRKELATMIANCDHGTIADCRIIETLAPRG